MVEEDVKTYLLSSTQHFEILRKYHFEAKIAGIERYLVLCMQRLVTTADGRILVTVVDMVHELPLDQLVEWRKSGEIRSMTITQYDTCGVPVRSWTLTAKMATDPLPVNLDYSQMGPVLIRFALDSVTLQNVEKHL